MKTKIICYIDFFAIFTNTLYLYFLLSYAQNPIFIVNIELDHLVIKTSKLSCQFLTKKLELN